MDWNWRVILGLILAVIGLALVLYASIVTGMQNTARDKWPRIPVQLVDSARGTYSYTVNGRSYTSENKTIGGTALNNEDERVYESFMNGSIPSIQAYYNPDKPDQSYLFIGETPWWAFIIGFILLIVGIIMALWDQIQKWYYIAKDETSTEEPATFVGGFDFW